jgi:hypothetical protein
VALPWKTLADDGWTAFYQRRLLWARDQGCVKAKARFANGDIDRPLMPSEQARLVEAATVRFLS